MIHVLSWQRKTHVLRPHKIRLAVVVLQASHGIGDVSAQALAVATIMSKTHGLDCLTPQEPCFLRHYTTRATMFVLHLLYNDITVCGTLELNLTASTAI